MTSAATSATRFGLLLLVGAVLALALGCGVLWLGALHPYLFAWALSLGATVGMFVLAVARRDDPERCPGAIAGFVFCLGGFAISCYFVCAHYFGALQ